MADALTLPLGVKATVTAYVTSPAAGLSNHVRLRSVGRVAAWAVADLLAKAVDDMNAVTELGDARPMTDAEIAAYLALEAGQEVNR